MQTVSNQNQTLLIVLAIGVLGLFIARYYSSSGENSEKSIAQEYVDSLTDSNIPRDNVNMKVVIKDLLTKIKSLERDKTIHEDKLSALHQRASIENEQAKYLTSNVLKSITS